MKAVEYHTHPLWELFGFLSISKSYFVQLIASSIFEKICIGCCWYFFIPTTPNAHKLKEFLNYLTKDKKAAMEY
jgi:hypothetical protein